MKCIVSARRDVTARSNFCLKF